MNLKTFKNEYRTICVDTWGDAIDGWFECAAHMFIRGLKLPNKWEYKANQANPTEKDSYWYEIFQKCTNQELETIGSFLFRYCLYLKHKNVDY